MCFIDCEAIDNVEHDKVTGTPILLLPPVSVSEGDIALEVTAQSPHLAVG